MQCRFGALAIAGTGRQEFEIIQLNAGGEGTAIARFSVEESGDPSLRLEPVPPERRNLGTIDEATDPVILDSRRGDYETNFELSVKRIENGIEINLSGDHKMKAARYFKVFLWRAECRIIDGTPALRGPYLMRDLDS